MQKSNRNKKAIKNKSNKHKMEIQQKSIGNERKQKTIKWKSNRN